MFRLYEWNFSSTIELVTGVLLIVTILAVTFAYQCGDVTVWRQTFRFVVS